MFGDSVQDVAWERQVDDLKPSRRDPTQHTAFGPMGRPTTNVLRDLLVLERPIRVRWWRVYARLGRIGFSFLIWWIAKHRDKLVGRRGRHAWLNKWEQARRDAGKQAAGIATIPRSEQRAAFLTLRAAVRLRDYIQNLGGTLVKIGQQASLRRDLLPDEYCDELETLFDEVTPFDKSVAYRAIEEQTGRPWQETFRSFDDEKPVGSASIACVYRAVLHNGDEVAVKVRRPRIKRTFTIDLEVLKRVAKLLEYLMVVQPDLLKSFIEEAEQMFFEELNFRLEVRYQELFRRYLHKRKKLNVTAPRVYHKLSGREVIVSEFVDGCWMDDIMAAVAKRDAQYLARLRRADIDIGNVARRLIRSQYYQFHECPFFHGDPHPGNIAVQKGGRIVMVDFGACGVFSGRDRNLMLQMHYYYAQGDVAGMVRCVVALMEPTLNIDIDAFSKHLQDEWWKGYYGIKSKHADWSERTSFRLWIALLQSFRKFALPMPLHMLRMVRATLLYDTVAAQLDAKINAFAQFEKYHRGVARRARVDIQECLIRQALLGPDDSVYLKIQRIVNVANVALFRLEKFLAEPDISFEGIVNKIYSFIGQTIQMIKTTFFVTVFMAVVAYAVATLYKNENAREMLKPTHLLTKMTETPCPWGWGWFVLAIWVLWLAVTMYSHGSRTMVYFRRKDDYRTERRVV
jgi:predicted unusual protein kinase regulating ubiquinone biosynthesis (AarF/ABC1/UbiB family)